MKTKETSNKMGKCDKCGAIQFLSYKRCNYNGICDGKVIPNKTNRELALEWWNKLTKNQQYEFCLKQSDVDDLLVNRQLSSLTGREIEEIYDKEILESKRQDEWQEFQVNQRYSKPNKKKFKEFNPELFKAYINKFSDEDKIKAIRSILPDLKIGLYINYVQEEDKSYWVFNSERIIVK